MKYLIHRINPPKKQPSTDAGDTSPKEKLSTPYSNTCVFLFSAATDGQVAVWSLDCIIRKWLGSLGCQLIEGEDTRMEEEDAVGKTLSSVGDLTAHEMGTAPNPIISIQVHQSGVNDIAISPIAGKRLCEDYHFNSSIKEIYCIPPGADSYYIATVGDDNAMAVTCFSVAISDGLVPKTSITVWKQWVEPAAHYSSITGMLVSNP